ncbi:hypothetical protein Hanom_Chr12g01076781 [Helianthus anomalus]
MGPGHEEPCTPRSPKRPRWRISIARIAALGCLNCQGLLQTSRISRLSPQKICKFDHRLCYFINLLSSLMDS